MFPIQVTWQGTAFGDPLQSMLAILALGAASFQAPFTVLRPNTRAHNDGPTRLVLKAPGARQLATPEAAQAASFEESQVLGAQLAEILAESCANGERVPGEAVKVLRSLVSTTAGARQPPWIAFF